MALDHEGKRLFEGDAVLVPCKIVKLISAEGKPTMLLIEVLLPPKEGTVKPSFECSCHQVIKHRYAPI